MTASSALGASSKKGGQGKQRRGKSSEIQGVLPSWGCALNRWLLRRDYDITVVVAGEQSVDSAGDTLWKRSKREDWSVKRLVKRRCDSRRTWKISLASDWDFWMAFFACGVKSLFLRGEMRHDPCTSCIPHVYLALLNQHAIFLSRSLDSERCVTS